VVLAGDTGKGKTSLACQIATHVTKQGKTVLYWSLEMPARALLRKMAYQMSGTDSRDLNPSVGARAKQRDALSWLCDHPIWFDEHSRTVGAFCSSVRYIKTRSNLGLIVVDYLGLIRASGRPESRTREVGENSRALKLAALGFDLPFLVLSQYRRPAKGESATIHSLKESGDIENDADVVLLMNSPEIKPDEDTTVDIHVGKQREGPSGFDVPLVFRPSSQSFQSPDDGR
jgi:replicative DNA helicase